jgi:hypothetical protein
MVPQIKCDKCNIARPLDQVLCSHCDMWDAGPDHSAHTPHGPHNLTLTEIFVSCAIGAILALIPIGICLFFK